MVKTPNDIPVSSWNELSDHLFAESWQESLGRFRSPFAFRGTCSTAHNLETSLVRLGGPYEKLEAVLLRNFRKYAHRATDTDDTIWNWLAIAQHHGLPTRMLDWTYSPLIALHFVTAKIEAFDTDGAVWAVDFMKLRDLLPDKLKLALQEEQAVVFNVELLNDTVGSLQEFDRLSPQPFTIFLEPPSLDQRIVTQSALFSMMSSPTASFDDWLADKPGLYRRIIIPASLKWEVRDKLDQLNITERILFPGLDGLSKYLRRYYSPRQG